MLGVPWQKVDRSIAQKKGKLAIQNLGSGKKHGVKENRKTTGGRGWSLKGELELFEKGLPIG